MATPKKENSTYGQTISIKHFLNTKLKPKIENGIETYPLYLQVRVKRQLTHIKSVLNLYFSHSQFDFDDTEKTLSHLLVNEKEFITNKIIKKKPFENEDFSLIETLKDYDASYDFLELIRLYIEKETREVLSTNFILILMKYRGKVFQPDFDSMSLTDKYDALKMVNKMFPSIANSITDFLPWSKDGNLFDSNFYTTLFQDMLPDIKDLRYKYSSEFWNIKDIIYEIYNKDPRITLLDFYSPDKYTKNPVTISDWLSGRFDNLFMRKYKDHRMLAAFHDSFNKLRATHAELDDFLEQFKKFTP